MKIILTGSIQSTNHIYKSHCKFGFPQYYMSKEGKALKESYQWEAKSQMKGKIIKGDVGIEIDLYFGDKRVHDIDNYGKILLDSLTGIVWEDDKQIQKMLVTKNYSKENPRIEIIINE